MVRVQLKAMEIVRLLSCRGDAAGYCLFCKGDMQASLTNIGGVQNVKGCRILQYSEMRVACKGGRGESERVQMSGKGRRHTEGRKMSSSRANG